jgi:hypothetical protein
MRGAANRVAKPSNNAGSSTSAHRHDEEYVRDPRQQRQMRAF